MMYFLIPAIVGVGVMTAAISMLPTQAVVGAQAAEAQLLQYQTFLYTANSYFTRNAAPVSTTAYSWSTLRAAAAPSHVNAGIPAHWKAVRRPDGSWVACTQINERAAARLPNLFPTQTDAGGAAVVPTVVPQASITLVVGSGGASESGTPTYVVVGEQSTAAASSANLCAGVT